MNNPLRYIDPSGHEAKCVDWDDDDNCTKYEDNEGDIGNLEAEDVVCSDGESGSVICTIPDSAADALIFSTYVFEGVELTLLALSVALIDAGLSVVPGGVILGAILTGVAAGLAFHEDQQWSKIRDELNEVNGDVTLELSRDPSNYTVSIDNGIGREKYVYPSMAGGFLNVYFQLPFAGE
jgi:hypothetical protein